MAASNSSPMDLTLQLPMSLLRQSTGCAMDMGGSVLKMAYMDKQDWEDVDFDKYTGETGTVRFMSFPADKLSEAFTFMKARFHIRPTGGESRPVVYVSGVGLQRHAKDVAELLGVRLEVVMETDCFVRALVYCIEHVPESEMAAPPPVTGLQQGVDRGRKIINHMQASVKAGTRPPLDFMDDLCAQLDDALQLEPRDEPLGASVQFPVLIAMMGSGSGFLMASKDGSYTMTAMSPVGGRTLLALGGLLTNSQDYEELMSLAEKGNQRALNIHLQDLVTQDGRTDTYSKAGALDLFVYAFGKGVGKTLDDFSREDLARSVLHLVAHNAMNMATTMMGLQGCHHLFVTGSFANHPTTRDILAEEFIQLQTKNSAFQRKMYPGKMHLMKFGGHLGALGALLRGCGQW